MANNTIAKRIQDLDVARQMYNTLRALTIKTVVQMLDEGEEGTFTRLAWTSRKVEKRWSVMIGLKANREGALLEKDWTIRTVPEDRLPKGYTERQAEAQADELRAAYERIENLREAVKHLHLATFRGFAHLEKINAAGRATRLASDVVRLEPLHQWHMIRRGIDGPWRFDELLRGNWHAALEVDASTLVVREVDDPICEVALPAYVYEMLGRKDWAGFIEIFGIPDEFFILPPGVNNDDLATWQNLLEDMLGAGKGFLPHGSDIKSVGGDVRGTSPFKEFVQFQREDVVLAGTGGKLTMMAESGSGTLGGNAQAEVFDRIAKREAREISELFQRAFDLPILRERFPGQPPLAWFEIDCEDEEDTASVVDNVAKLAQQGYIVEPDQVQEKTGLRVTYQPKPAETAAPEEQPPVRNRRSLLSRILNRKYASALDELRKNARVAIASSIELDLRPIAASLADLLDNTADEDLAGALQSWRDNMLPGLLESALDDPATADAYADTLSAALVNGLVEAPDA